MAEPSDAPKGEPGAAPKVEPGSASNGSSAAWQEAIAGYLRDLKARGGAARTLRAYRTDLEQFAAWAAGEPAPPAVSHKDVRRYASGLSAPVSYTHLTLPTILR